jgi:DNA-binding CsgD family transcriptional regulator
MRPEFAGAVVPAPHAIGAPAARLLEALADGVALVAADGTIVLSNAAFARLAAPIEPPTANGGLPRLGRRLAGLVARAAAEGVAAATLGAEAPPSLAAFAVAIDPSRPARDVALALIALDAPPASPARLAELFGLTPAESSTASLVSGGLAPRAVAGLVGVSLATVKTHLHHAFAKTGTRGQAALARLLRRADGPFGR